MIWGKCFIFASEMKMLCQVIVSALLTVAILSIGSGVNMMRCAHTGTVKMMTVMSSAHMDGMGCGMNSSCMTMERVELSPTIITPVVNPDFHGVQPLLSMLPCFIATWFVPTGHMAVAQFVPTVWKSPPRDYLSLIQVLLI